MMLSWFLLFPVFAETPNASELEQVLRQTNIYRNHRIALNLPNIPSEIYHTLSVGEVVTGLEEVDGSSAKIGWGIGIFPLPIEQMFAAINDEEYHVELSPVDATIVTAGKPCTDGRSVFMHLPVPMFDDRWWITTHRTNPNIRKVSSGKMAELSWSAIPNPSLDQLPPQILKSVEQSVKITKSTGAWLLIKVDETHTLGEYHSWSDPGGYIPAGVASSLGARGIEKNFFTMMTYAQNEKIQCQYSW